MYRVRIRSMCLVRSCKNETLMIGQNYAGWFEPHRWTGGRTVPECLPPSLLSLPGVTPLKLKLKLDASAFSPHLLILRPSHTFVAVLYCTSTVPHQSPAADCLIDALHDHILTSPILASLLHSLGIAALHLRIITLAARALSVSFPSLLCPIARRQNLTRECNCTGPSSGLWEANRATVCAQ